METRKVQLSGGTTFTISLPKRWAREHNIEAGCAVRLDPNDDGTLLVEPVNRQRPPRYSGMVDIGHHDSHGVLETIKAMYAVGYDQVKLRDPDGQSVEQERTIAEFLHVLSGFEIAEEDDASITLRNLLASENVSIRKNAIRMQLTALGMYRDAIEAVLTDDTELGDDVIRRDEEANKMYALVARQFRRSLSDLQAVQALNHSRAELFEYYYIVDELEDVADNAEEIVCVCRQHSAAIPSEFDEQLEQLATESIRIVEQASEIFLQSGEVRDIYRILELFDSLNTDLKEFNRQLYSHDVDSEAHLTSLVIDLLQATAEHGDKIAKMALQRAVREEETPVTMDQPTVRAE